MRLARQATRTEPAIRKRHTALPLHVHWPLGLCTFGFRFVLLLLLGTWPLSIAVNLAFLALLSTRLEALDRRLPRSNVIIVLALFFSERRVFRFLGLLLLPLLVCLFVQAVADMCGRSRTENRSAAVLALYRVDLVIQGAASLETSERLLVEWIDDRRPCGSRIAVDV